MKAIVQYHFGPPDTLQLVVDAEKSEIGSGEVLLEVHAAAVNPYDWHTVRISVDGRPVAELSVALS